jgi:hypothetical protein
MAAVSSFWSGSNSTKASQLASSTARDSVGDPLKACQLLLLRRSLPLDIDMDHVDGLRPLVAEHGFSGLHLLECLLALVERPGTKPLGSL